MEKNTGSGDTENVPKVIAGLIEKGKVFKTYEEKASEEALAVDDSLFEIGRKKAVPELTTYISNHKDDDPEGVAYASRILDRFQVGTRAGILKDLKRKINSKLME